MSSDQSIRVLDEQVDDKENRKGKSVPSSICDCGYNGNAILADGVGMEGVVQVLCSGHDRRSLVGWLVGGFLWW